jgi:hypothetical protein
MSSSTVPSLLPFSFSPSTDVYLSSDADKQTRSFAVLATAATPKSSVASVTKAVHVRAVSRPTRRVPQVRPCAIAGAGHSRDSLAPLAMKALCHGLSDKLQKAGLQRRQH